MEVLEEELIKYKSAKNCFHYDRALESAKDENGIVNEEKLNEILENIYKKMISYLEDHSEIDGKRNPSVNRNIARINELYKLVRNRTQMQYLSEVLKQDNTININEKDMLKASSQISKIGYVLNKSPKTLLLNINSGNGNRKTVRISRHGTLAYRTSFNVSSEIDVYKITKNIQGLDRNFTVFTNTLFNKVEMLMRKKASGERLSEEEEAYILKVQEQLSDNSLLACQRKLNGYIGTVEGQKDSVGIVFDPDDYRACKAFIDKVKDNKEEKEK